MAKASTKYRDDIAKVVHEGASGMHRLGLIDAKTMRNFDLSCLTTVEDLSARDIAAIRKREGVSQAIFARALNVTTGYISQIERGEKCPRGATLKLLSLVKAKGLAAIL